MINKNDLTPSRLAVLYLYFHLLFGENNRINLMMLTVIIAEAIILGKKAGLTAVNSAVLLLAHTNTIQPKMM